MNIMLPSSPILAFGDTIIGWFEEVVDAFIAMITAIPEAIASIFGGWPDTIIAEGWYGPVLATIVVVIIFLIIYGAIWLQDVFFE